MALPPDDPPPGVPEWVVTYGDMMSLLLTFFIMLVSMAEVKQEGKLRMMLDAVKEQFGPTAGEFGVPGTSFATTGAFPTAASRGTASEGGTERSGLDSPGLAGPSRSVERLGDGTQITLGGPALFPPESDELTAAAREALSSIAHVLGPRPNRIVIRGHAGREARLPGQAEVDPYDLSYRRARAAAGYLVERGIDRHRLSVCAAGASEPRTVSRDLNQRALNHRVDVFVIDSYISPDQRQPEKESATSALDGRPRLPRLAQLPD
jgi:chemotaxis protein MotB